MNTEDRIKLFGMSHYLVERELDKVEQGYHLELHRSEKDDKDEEYYPQFDIGLRSEAAQMARHYELFYCLEKNIRKLISDTLESAHGENWWNTCVPQPVKDNVQKNIQREKDSGITLRSEHEIDFTTFGELGEIVRTNWDSFDAIFSNEKAFTRIMTSLNILRSPIAHCSPLAEDEVIRLQLALKDWFRLME
jgi:Swt1-like HEPN